MPRLISIWWMAWGLSYSLWSKIETKNWVIVSEHSFPVQFWHIRYLISLPVNANRNSIYTEWISVSNIKYTILTENKRSFCGKYAILSFWKYKSLLLSGSFQQIFEANFFSLKMSSVLSKQKLNHDHLENFINIFLSDKRLSTFNSTWHWCNWLSLTSVNNI